MVVALGVMVSGEQKDETSGHYYGIIVTGKFLGLTENSRQNIKLGFYYAFNLTLPSLWEVFFPVTSQAPSTLMCVYIPGLPPEYPLGPAL